MARPITRQLRSLMPASVTVEPVTKDKWGDETYGAAVLIEHCRIRKGNRIVKDRTGQEVVSGTQVTLDGVYGFTAEDRWTLPAGTRPQQPPAINVFTSQDENGDHHDMVAFK